MTQTNTRPHNCRPCQHRSRNGTCLEAQAAGLAERFVIVWPPEGHARKCPAYTPKGKP